MNNGHTSVDTTISQFTNLTASCFRAFGDTAKHNPASKSSNVSAELSRRRTLLGLLKQAQEARPIIDKLLVTDRHGLEKHIDTWKGKGSTQATDTHIRSGGRGQHSTTAKSNPWNFQSNNSATIEKMLVDKSIDVAVVPSFAKREVLSDGEYGVVDIVVSGVFRV
jgi:hypothetical protein